MANNKFLVVMLVMALAFGMALVGCASEGGAGSGPSGADSVLNGTWADSSEEIKFDNGDFEIIDGGTPLVKGTYVASGGTITMTLAQYYGGHSTWKGNLQPRWYSRNQLKASAFGANASDAQLDELFRRTKGTYSISGNKLNLVLKGFASGTYTKTASQTGSSKQSGQYMIVNTDTLNVRSGPSADSSIVGTLPRNTRVEILDRPGQWYKIRSGKIEGYVNSSLLKEE